MRRAAVRNSVGMPQEADTSTLEDVAERARTEVEEFIHAFDAVESGLQRMQRANTKFYSLVESHNWGKDKETPRFLKKCGDLRNFLSHGRSKGTSLMAVPAAEVTARLVQIEVQVAGGPTLAVRMAQPVQTLRTEDSLMTALELIFDHDFSQLPVYSAEKEFNGLLTERSIGRWLAKERHREVKHLDFHAVRIGSVLRASTGTRAFNFRPPDYPVRAAIMDFSRNQELEAILVSPTGNNRNPVTGIFTLWNAKECLKAGE